MTQTSHPHPTTTVLSSPTDPAPVAGSTGAPTLTVAQLRAEAASWRWLAAHELRTDLGRAAAHEQAQRCEREIERLEARK